MSSNQLSALSFDSMAILASEASKRTLKDEMRCGVSIRGTLRLRTES